MSAPADAVTPPVPTPRRVYMALALLWAAWAISACTLAVRVFFFALPLGWLGFIGLLVQGLLIYFISKRSNAARIVVLIILLISTAGASLLLHALAQASMSAIPTIAGHLLRAAALILLFTGDSRPWFRGS